MAETMLSGSLYKTRQVGSTNISESESSAMPLSLGHKSLLCNHMTDLMTVTEQSDLHASHLEGRGKSLVLVTKIFNIYIYFGGGECGGG